MSENMYMAKAYGSRENLLHGMTQTERQAQPHATEDAEKEEMTLITQFVQNAALTLFKYEGLFNPEKNISVSVTALESAMRFMGLGVAIGRDQGGVYTILGTASNVTSNTYGQMVADGMISNLAETAPASETLKRYSAQNTDGNYVLATNKITPFPQNLRDMPLIELYARKLAHTSASMDLNKAYMRQPYVPVVEKGNNTMKNFFKRVLRGDLVVEMSKGFHASDAQFLDVNVPDFLDTLRKQYDFDYGQMWSRLGVSYFSGDKAERLVAAEANSNLAVVSAYGNDYLLARRQFCDELNQLIAKETGENPGITVNWNFETVKEITNIMGAKSTSEEALDGNKPDNRTQV